jgi:hypothetical protein
MIQLNGILPLSTKFSEPSLVNSANPTDGASFQSELSAALTATLQQFGINPNNVNLSIAPIANSTAQPQTNAASTPATTAAATAAPASTAASSTPASASTNGTSSSTDSILSFDNAYWASQPPAVQALRNIDDPAQRSELAGQLAASGYQIDAPIMVWGWDPSQVTSLRQEMGYTWVPSAMQNPVAAAPGDGIGSQSYDPSNPPSGSIPVPSATSA